MAKECLCLNFFFNEMVAKLSLLLGKETNIQAFKAPNRHQQKIILHDYYSEDTEHTKQRINIKIRKKKNGRLTYKYKYIRITLDLLSEI